MKANNRKKSLPTHSFFTHLFVYARQAGFSGTIKQFCHSDKGFNRAIMMLLIKARVGDCSSERNKIVQELREDAKSGELGRLQILIKCADQDSSPDNIKEIEQSFLSPG